MNFSVLHRLRPLRTIGLLAACLTVFLQLGSCASVEPQVYAAEKPALDLRQYFNGVLDGQGIFQERSGKVVKRFVVVIKAQWKGEVGTLDEDFTYSDGTKQRRVWTITHLGAGKYSGTADDVVGSASGEQSGNALHWTYTMALPVDGKTYHVQFDDWMFLIDDRTMLNRAQMSKFGVRLGDVLLSFQKRAS
jgi:Protein of unknown function (DUF3833)